MIQIVTQPTAAMRDELRAWLDDHGRRRAPVGDRLACGAGGELDPRWLDVLRTSMGHRPHLIVARRHGPRGDLAGYLPLVLVRSRWFGRFLVSLPYLNRGGVVADDVDTGEAMVREAVGLAQQLDGRYLELRHTEPVAHDALPTSRDDKVHMMLALPDSGEALWHGFPAKVRNQVRKGDRHALTIRWGGEALLPAFYRIFSVNMRDLGTPAYPRRLFANVLQHFGERAEIAVVNMADQAVAAALLVHAADATRVPSASSLRRFNHTCANMWLYHRLLARAIERGSRTFDFGRSSVDSGTYRFKRQWGASPHPTRWQYHVRVGDVNAMRPEDPRYRRWIAAWKRLPVWMTRLVGPQLVRGIP